MPHAWRVLESYCYCHFTFFSARVGTCLTELAATLRRAMQAWILKVNRAELQSRGCAINVLITDATQLLLWSLTGAAQDTKAPPLPDQGQPVGQPGEDAALPHIPSANAEPMPDMESSDMAITAPKAGMKQTRSFLLSTSCLRRDEVAHSCMMRCTRLHCAGLLACMPLSRGVGWCVQP